MLTALRFCILSLLLCGGLYNLVTTQLAALLFPQQANGSLLLKAETIIGSSLIGQTFTTEKYLHGRPSANQYDPRSAAGSNWGPKHADLIQRITQEAQHIQQRDQVAIENIPLDLLAASGSGLDPHISPAAAVLQLPRIAQARQLTLDQVKQVLIQHHQPPQWGIFGQERVNVLQFNLALDALPILHNHHLPADH